MTTTRKHPRTLHRRQLVQRTAAGLGAAALAGAYPGGPLAAQEATPFGEPTAQGGSAVIATGGTGSPRVFIPTSFYGTQTFFVCKLIYTPLLMLDRAWETIGPGLAQAWEWNADGTVLTMSLRDDVQFHDGTPFTAADVEFTFKLGIRADQYFAVPDPGVIQGGLAYRDGSSEELPGVRVVDDATVEFTLESPTHIFELNLSNCGILPSHLFADDALASGTVIDELPFFNGESGFESGLVVGTGPWRAVEYNPESNLTLARNDSYFKGAPNLDEVILRYGVEGPAIIAGLQAGEIDSAYITGEDAQTLESVEQIELAATEGLVNGTCFLNATEKEYMSVPVRQALLHALDRETLMESLTYGYGYQVPSVMMHPSLFPNDELAEYPYDPELARQMLEEAGWDFDRTLRFGQFTDQGAPTDVISAIMSQWSEIGIKAEYVPLDAANQITIGQSEDHPYDLVITGFAWVAYDPSTSYQSFGCEQRPNYSNYCNEVYDEAMLTAVRQATLEEAVPYYQEAQVILQEELPYSYLWAVQDIWAINARLHGGNLGRGPLNDIESELWWKESE